MEVERLEKSARGCGPKTFLKPKLTKHITFGAFLGADMIENHVVVAGRACRSPTWQIPSATFRTFCPRVFFSGVAEPFGSEQTVCKPSNSAQWFCMHGRISLLDGGPWLNLNAKFGQFFEVSSKTNLT